MSTQPSAGSVSPDSPPPLPYPPGGANPSPSGPSSAQSGPYQAEALGQQAPQYAHQPVHYPEPGAEFPSTASGPGSAPSVVPVVAFTFFFGLLGAISAARRSAKARAVGASTSRYWIAFAATLAIGWVAIFGIVLAINAASGTTINSAYLEKSIVKNGDFSSGATKATATAATCTPAEVTANGAGTYRCMIDFSDGDRQSFAVTVGPDGKWVTDSGS
jgi:hypothetical protein